MSGYAQDGFERSRALFEQVVAELTGQDADEQTHTQLDEQVAVRGRELMRQLYQDHLSLRATNELRAGGWLMPSRWCTRGSSVTISAR